MNKNLSDNSGANETDSDDDSKVAGDRDKSGLSEESGNVENGKSDSKKTPLSVIIAGVVLTGLVIVCLQVDDWSRDWTTNMAETDPAANDVNMQPVESSLSASEFCEKVVNTMTTATRWEVVSKKKVNEALVELNLVHKTFWLGFKDDVKAEFVKTEGGSTMYVTSQSRIGKGDLGQNPRNIREMVGLVRAELAKSKESE